MEAVVKGSSRPSLLVFKKDGYWWISTGELLEADYWEARISPASTHFLSLIAAIDELYSTYKIWVDTNVTENPFVVEHIKTSRHYGMTPNYQEIQKALDYPQEMKCTRCNSAAWYNRNGFQCRKCGATSSLSNPYDFFKVIRRF